MTQNTISLASEVNLRFDPAKYETLKISLDNNIIQVKKYSVIYVANPVRFRLEQIGKGGKPQRNANPYVYQTMNIYLSEYADRNMNAPIIFMVHNGGWKASVVEDSVDEGIRYSGNSNDDLVGAALKAGYVLVDAGTRSRGIIAEDGSFLGKAPAAVVDAKAAIRYLRLNSDLIPGSTDRIVITGISGGGALSVAIASSGNSPDYYPYLSEVGAAGISADGTSSLRDDVFATIAYCPITDLANADAAYEWQYAATRLIKSDYYASLNGDYQFLPEPPPQGPPDSQPPDKHKYYDSLILSPQQKEASDRLSEAYIRYFDSLDLKREDGTPLTADNLPEVIIELVTAEINRVLVSGSAHPCVPDLGEDFILTIKRGPGGPKKPGELSDDPPPYNLAIKNEWLKLSADRKSVECVDYEKYLDFVASIQALKPVPSFDQGDVSQGGESNLFGTPSQIYSNFTAWSWDHNASKGDGIGKEDTGMSFDEYLETTDGKELKAQLKLTSPIPYLSSGSVKTAPYWYVRHGIRDRDTAFAIEVELYYMIKSQPQVKDINFKFTWLNGHAGNYDVQEAFSWLADIL
ncbi:MAG: alpha/beta hydrolase [Lachnospiraceae bacterium]|jgi:acetyl esterase/lipase|nr:alpha/beta hydrolase [Lachnospiraceae bacterium]